MTSLQGKVAIITGAGSGIGTALVSHLLDKGMEVVGLDKDEHSLQEVLKNVINKKGKFHAHTVDLKEETDIVNAFTWVEKNLGEIHVLVNCAGVLPNGKPISESSTELLRSVIEVNFLAVLLCSREAIQSMNRHNIEGHIVNIGRYKALRGPGKARTTGIKSVAAHLSAPKAGFVTYGATKRAVQIMSEGIRLELAKANSNIRVTTICPGTVQTGLFTAAGLNFPNRPYLQPKDVASTIVFCLEMPLEAHISELYIQPLKEDLTTP